MSGANATLILKKDAKLDEKAIAKAIGDAKLKFVSLEKKEVEKAARAYVAKCPGFT